MEFDSYVAHSREALVRLGVVLTGEPELAEDLVQDVLLSAQQRWEHIGALDYPHAYVRRMLANRVVSWRRKWGRIEPRPDADLDQAHPDPTDAFARRDSLWRAVTALPPRQRAVVVLRYFEDLTDAEIAEIFDCQTATVRGYLHRALKTLRVEHTQEPELTCSPRPNYATHSTTPPITPTN
jgi:RNA polymerase sigma-70 factor (sigma-E family)